MPFGFVRDENEGGEIQCNLLLNFRKDILSEKVPYIVHPENPAIDNVVKGCKIDDIALEKYLLVMGLMMGLSDGRFNKASICKVLDTKYPSVMKKANPVDVAFKDKAKFNVQDPVICTLLAQVN